MSLDPFYHGFHVTCIISYHELAVARGEKPTYPSLKAKRTDWDKLEPQLKKEVCQLHIYKMFLFFVGWYTWFLYPNTSFQEKEEKLDGDVALNKFFREIYQDADEDTRRAMRKSFVSFFVFYLW